MARAALTASCSISAFPRCSLMTRSGDSRFVSTGHSICAWAATGRVLPLEFTVDERIEVIELKAAVSVTGVELYTQAALAGLGIVQVPRYHVEDALADGRLQCVLAGFPPPPMPVSVLYPHNRQLSARVRVFVDWVSAVFAQGNGHHGAKTQKQKRPASQ